MLFFYFHTFEVTQEYLEKLNRMSPQYPIVHIRGHACRNRGISFLSSLLVRHSWRGDTILNEMGEPHPQKRESRELTLSVVCRMNFWPFLISAAGGILGYGPARST